MKIRMTLMLVLAVVFAACGGESAETTTAETTGETTATTTGETTPTTGEVVEIPVWVAFTDYRLDWANDVAAAFNAGNPAYQVVIQGFDDYESLFNATLLGAEQGNRPAVVQYFEAATQEARDAVDPEGEPLFKSVEEAIGGNTEIAGIPVILDDIVAPARNYYTLDGSFTSMPWNTSSAIMFTNMTMLEGYGITEIPDTWQGIEAACETIMAAGDAPEACITWPNHSWFFEQTIAQQGALLSSNDNGRSARSDEVYVDSEAAVDYVTWWKEMADAGHYLYTGVQRDWDGTYNAFASQQLPFLIYSSSDTTAITNEGVNGGFEVVASFMPHNGDRPDGGNIIGGASLWLVNNLDPAVEEGALAFMNFFSNTENAASWHQLTGYIPISDSAIAALEAEGWYDENPNSRVASEQLAAAPATPATAGALIGNFVAIRDVITGAIEDILVNDLDVAERLATANTEANRLLADYNALYGG